MRKSAKTLRHLGHIVKKKSQEPKDHGLMENHLTFHLEEEIARAWNT